MNLKAGPLPADGFSPKQFEHIVSPRKKRDVAYSHLQGRMKHSRRIARRIARRFQH